MSYLEPILWRGAYQDYRIRRDWFRFSVNMMSAPLGLLFGAAAFEGPRMAQYFWGVPNSSQETKKTPVVSNHGGKKDASKHTVTNQSSPDHLSQPVQSKAEVQQVVAPLNSKAEPMQKPDSQSDSGREKDLTAVTDNKPEPKPVEVSADASEETPAPQPADTSVDHPVEESSDTPDDHPVEESSDTSDDHLVEQSNDASGDDATEEPAAAPEDSSDEQFEDQQSDSPDGDKEDAPSGLTATQAEVLAALRENPRMTKPLLVSKLNRSKTTIDNSIRALREKGLLVRIGSNKTGHWEVIDPQ